MNPSLILFLLVAAFFLYLHSNKENKRPAFFEFKYILQNPIYSGWERIPDELNPSELYRPIDAPLQWDSPWVPEGEINFRQHRIPYQFELIDDCDQLVTPLLSRHGQIYFLRHRRPHTTNLSSYS